MPLAAPAASGGGGGETPSQGVCLRLCGRLWVWAPFPGGKMYPKMPLGPPPCPMPLGG